MKLKNLALFASLIIAGYSSFAQGTTNYVANITTPGTTTNLFISPGVVAPVGTALWFVADKSGDGLGIGVSGDVNLSVINNWSGQAGENLLIYSDSVDGQILGIVPGRFTRNSVNISPTLGVTFTDARLGQEVTSATKVWAVLWNDSTPGQIGDQFSILDLGTVGMPTSGNAAWNISANPFIANGFTVVPEPSTYALFGLGGLGLLLQRRMRKS